MLEIITQLVAASIDPDKIPSFDWFNLRDRKDGKFQIVLLDGTRIEIQIDINESDKN